MTSPADAAFGADLESAPQAQLGVRHLVITKYRDPETELGHVLVAVLGRSA